MQAFTQRHKEYAGGALMLLLGIGAIAIGRTYSVGTLSHMGPGFFPVALGSILSLVGLVIAATAWITPLEEEEKTALPPEWRGWFCIVASLIAFVVLGEYGGLIPATFAIVFISALGDRDNSLRSAMTLAVAIVVVCLIVFHWALQMQFPLFAWGRS